MMNKVNQVLQQYMCTKYMCHCKITTYMLGREEVKGGGGGVVCFDMRGCEMQFVPFVLRGELWEQKTRR